jgi:hypothetical protein
MLVSWREEGVREEYERRVLRRLRSELLEQDPGYKHEGNRVRVEDVHLEDEEVGGMVVVLLREETRPECLFGFRMEASDPEGFDPSSPEEPFSPKLWASIVAVNVEERIEAGDLGLPPDCDPGGTTWINGYRRLPPA